MRKRRGKKQATIVKIYQSDSLRESSPSIDLLLIWTLTPSCPRCVARCFFFLIPILSARGAGKAALTLFPRRRASDSEQIRRRSEQKIARWECDGVASRLHARHTCCLDSRHSDNSKLCRRDRQVNRLQLLDPTPRPHPLFSPQPPSCPRWSTLLRLSRRTLMLFHLADCSR